MKERLLSAGLKLFLQQGFNATGIQEIANEAGAPKGSFYNHFSSKESFGASIIDLYADELYQYWEDTMAKAPEEPDEAIRFLFNQMISHHENRQSHLGCLLGNLSAEISSSSEACRMQLISANQEWRKRLAELIQKAQQQGKAQNDLDPMAASSIIWSVWTGSLLRMKNEKSVEPVKDNMERILGLLIGSANKS